VSDPREDEETTRKKEKQKRKKNNIGNKWLETRNPHKKKNRRIDRKDWNNHKKSY
jgi:hypothetical protein